MKGYESSCQGMGRSGARSDSGGRPHRGQPQRWQLGFPGNFSSPSNGEDDTSGLVQSAKQARPIKFGLDG